MNQSLSTVLTIAILALSYVLYQAWVVVPREKIQLEKDNQIKMQLEKEELKLEKEKLKEKKDELTMEYEICTRDTSVSYNLSWLRNCDNVKPLDNDCKKILNSDYPWGLHYTYYAHIETGFPEFTKKDAGAYQEFLNKFQDCQCKTLPNYIAQSLESDLEKAKKNCREDFESKLKVLN